MIIFLIGTLNYSSSVSHSNKKREVSKSAKFVGYFLTAMGSKMNLITITKNTDLKCSFLKNQQLMAKVVRRINKIKPGMHKLKKLRVGSSGKRRKFYRNLGKVHLAKMLRDLFDPIKNCSVIPKNISNHIKQFLKTIVLIQKGTCFKRQCKQFSFRELNRVYRYFLASIAHSKLRRIKFQKGKKSMKNKKVRSNQERSSGLIRRIAEKLATLLKTFIKNNKKTNNTNSIKKLKSNQKAVSFKNKAKNNFSGFSGSNHDYPINNLNNHPENIPNTNVRKNPNVNPNINPKSNPNNYPIGNVNSIHTNRYPSNNQNRISKETVATPNHHKAKKQNKLPNDSSNRYPSTNENNNYPDRISKETVATPNHHKAKKQNKLPNLSSNRYPSNRHPNTNPNNNYPDSISKGTVTSPDHHKDKKNYKHPIPNESSNRYPSTNPNNNYPDSISKGIVNTPNNHKAKKQNKLPIPNNPSNRHPNTNPNNNYPDSISKGTVTSPDHHKDKKHNKHTIPNDRSYNPKYPINNRSDNPGLSINNRSNRQLPELPK